MQTCQQLKYLVFLYIRLRWIAKKQEIRFELGPIILSPSFQHRFRKRGVVPRHVQKKKKIRQAMPTMPEKTEPSAMKNFLFSTAFIPEKGMDLLKSKETREKILCRHSEWIDDQIPSRGTYLGVISSIPSLFPEDKQTRLLVPTDQPTGLDFSPCQDRLEMDMKRLVLMLAHLLVRLKERRGKNRPKLDRNSSSMPIRPVWSREWRWHLTLLTRLITSSLCLLGDWAS